MATLQFASSASQTVPCDNLNRRWKQGHFPRPSTSANEKKRQEMAGLWNLLLLYDGWNDGLNLSHFLNAVTDHQSQAVNDDVDSPAQLQVVTTVNAMLNKPESRYWRPKNLCYTSQTNPFPHYEQTKIVSGKLHKISVSSQNLKMNWFVFQDRGGVAAGCAGETVQHWHLHDQLHLLGTADVTDPSWTALTLGRCSGLQHPQYVNLFFFPLHTFLQDTANWWERCWQQFITEQSPPEMNSIKK